MQKNTINRIDKLFAEWDRDDSPGCALGIITNGRFVYRNSYGMADLEHSVPISDATVFRIASLSKQFTAMSIALLAEQGRISLDDELHTSVPEIPRYAAPVLIQHLIWHTSGIRDYLALMRIAGMHNDDLRTDSDILELLARQKGLNFLPGDEYLYSNSGYFLLSAVVKRAGGTSLRKFAEEYIFRPLGMDHSHFHDDHAMAVMNSACGYSPGENGGFKKNMISSDIVGDGGMFTTVDDLLVWDRNFYTNTLGKRSPELIDRFLKPGTLNNGTVLDYASGLFVREYRGSTIVRHGGRFGGFRSEMLRFPEQKCTVICCANLSTIDTEKLAQKVADICLFKTQPEEDAGEAAHTGPEPSGADTDPCSAECPEKYAGQYYSDEVQAVCDISLDCGELRARFGTSEPAPLVPAGCGSFVSGTRKVRFMRDEENSVHMLTVSEERARNIPFLKHGSEI